jgi:DNA-binding transcriptional regulator YiaG
MEITAEAIKKFREENKMTLEDLARKIDVGLNTVWRWEAGLSKPSRLAVKALKKLMDK